MKMFRKIIFILFICKSIFPQAAVNIPITISDNASHSQILYIGLDPLATDTYDLDLGEADLPPAPPEGSFDARLVFPAGGYNSSETSLKDYRGAVLPYSGTKDYRTKFQIGIPATTITISWNLPSGVTGFLKDATLGFLLNVPMTGNGSYTLTEAQYNNTIYRYLKMIMTFDNAVPVELSSFSARVRNKEIHLLWETQTEVHNYGFEIERSTDKKNWKKIGFVEGYGNSNIPHSYSFIDKEEKNRGIYYFRLKQIDTDGHIDYSEIIEVNYQILSSFQLFQNYPNPFNPKTKISFSLEKESRINLMIYNNQGELVEILINNELYDPGSYWFTWDASNFQSGIYFLELKNESNSIVKKLSLIK
jgi:hypothetical protein